MWKNRNNFVFDQTPYPPTNVTLYRACILVNEFIAHLPPITSHPQVDPHIRERVFSTVVLYPCWCVLCGHSNKTSLAGVVHENHGNWLFGFHCISYAANPLFAELLAIRQPLHAASDANITHIALHSDSKKAVDLINSHDEVFDDFYSEIITDCRELQLYFRMRRLIFTKREDNKVADKLAHEYRSRCNTLNVIRHFSNPPNYCQDIVMDDYIRLFTITL